MPVIFGGNVIAGAETRTVRFTGVPVDGPAGTLAGVAEIGWTLTNDATGILYINTGTQASPTWTVVGTQV